MMPGAVDPNTQSSNMLGASPLYGVRQLNQKNPTFDQAMTNSAFNNSATKYPSTPMDPMKLQQMRQQLLDSQAKPLGQNSLDQNSDQNSDQDSTTPGNAAKMGLQSLGSPMQAPFESPENGAVRNSTSIVQPTQGGTTVGLSANLATGQSVKQRLVNQPVRIQSAQYSELQKRLAQYKSIQDQTTAQAAVQYNNDQVRAKNTPAAQGGGKPGDRPVLGGLPQPAMPDPGAGQREVSPIPAGPAMPSSATDLNPTPNVTPAMPGVKPGETAVTGNKIETMPMPVRPAPLKIKSLADGVQAKGIADMLKDAEELTRNGKYNSALEQYDMADQVAPNNALVQLGRANVELGRTYYARAEANLRQAFTQDQALLMGQYDLTSLLGQERLETIVRDLRAIAEREQKEPRPMFLLAYIAYNTGNEPRAAAYLDLAEKRAGGHDPLYPLIRKHWALPSDAAPVNATK